MFCGWLKSVIELIRGRRADIKTSFTFDVESDGLFSAIEGSGRQR